jgi:hypothetical protein
MSIHKGKGQSVHQNVVQCLTRRFTKDDLSGVYSMGWLPANSVVIGSGVGIRQAWNGTGDEALDLGFRNSVQGLTTDDDAFTETILDLDAAVGHIAGDVVSAANIMFSQPAEVIGTITNTNSTAGDAIAYVTYIVLDTE